MTEKSQEIRWNEIARYLSGELDQQSDGDVENHISESPALQKEISQLQNLWDILPYFPDIEKIHTARALQKVKSRFPEKEEKPNNRIVYLSPALFRYAAVILLLIMISLGSYLYLRPQPGFLNQHKWDQLASHNNEIIKIFPDGSKAILNAHTQLFYSDHFKEGKRVVFLEGEAFFDVSPDPENPFIVKTHDATVQVLGTSFNIKSYKGNNNTTITVNEGTVEFSKNGMFSAPKEKILLNRGFQGKIHPGTGLPVKKQVNCDNYFAWYTRDFSFQQTPLVEVKDILESAYHVQIHFQDPELSKLRLTARFNDEDLNSVIEIIKRTFDLRVNRNEKDRVVFFQ